MGSYHTFVLMDFRGYIEAFSGLELRQGGSNYGNIKAMSFVWNSLTVSMCISVSFSLCVGLCCSTVFISAALSLYGLLTPKVPYILEARAVFFTFLNEMVACAYS